MLVTNMDEFHRHVEPEELERYSLGDTPAEEAAGVEEHLLICQHCRLKLDQTEEFLAAMQAAAAKLDRTGKRPRWRLIPLLGAAAGMAALVVLALRWQGNPQPPLAVDLIATRAGLSAAAVPAGRAIALHADLTGLPASASHRLEIVDRNGGRVWRGELAATRDAVNIPGQRAGVYFVRVYTQGGELLREYGLEIKP